MFREGFFFSQLNSRVEVVDTRTWNQLNLSVAMESNHISIQISALANRLMYVQQVKNSYKNGVGGLLTLDGHILLMQCQRGPKSNLWQRKKNAKQQQLVLD